MEIERQAKTLIEQALRNNPAAVIVGPRQCGKTTLAKTFQGRYFDLEQERQRIALDLTWPSLIAGNDLIILDEVQSYPACFPRLRGAIDERRQNRGRFLLLGSVAPALMRDVGESLAGRLEIIELTPFCSEELDAEQAGRQWFFGGYPDGGVLGSKQSLSWQRNYLSLLAQRDLPLWGLSAKPQLTDRLFTMIAAQQGGLWNASQIAKSLGLSYHTVNEYLDYLEGAFLIRRLQPYSANIGKRLVKAPKVYWRDSGLLHSLLGIRKSDDLVMQPWVGASFEGYIVEQLINGVRLWDPACEAYFFRAHEGQEIDLLLSLYGKPVAVEIKLTTDPSPQDLAKLNRAADLVDADYRLLITRSPETSAGDKHFTGTLAPALSWLRKRHSLA